MRLSARFYRSFFFALRQPSRRSLPTGRPSTRKRSKTLQSYIRINTSVPPGDVTKAADLLVGILEREGIPVKRFESGPGPFDRHGQAEGHGSGQAAACSFITWTSCPPTRAAGRAIRSAARSPTAGSGDAARWT